MTAHVSLNRTMNSIRVSVSDRMVKQGILKAHLSFFTFFLRLVIFYDIKEAGIKLE